MAHLAGTRAEVAWARGRHVPVPSQWPSSAKWLIIRNYQPGASARHPKIMNLRLASLWLLSICLLLPYYTCHRGLLMVDGPSWIWMWCNHSFIENGIHIWNSKWISSCSFESMEFLADVRFVSEIPNEFPHVALNPWNFLPICVIFLHTWAP
jgi:hypothetical protein